MRDTADPTCDDIPSPAAALSGNRPLTRGGLRGLSRAFFALVAVTFALMVLGALVRSNEAGLACPDWPLCFGDFIPQMNLHVAFEWSHRLIAGGVSLAFAGLALATLRRPDAPAAARPLLAVASGLLAVQIVLGALTVWLKLASWTVTAHLITGNSFTLTLLLIACAVRDVANGRPARAPARPAARVMVFASAAGLLLQMILGGLLSSRYAGLACPEWPTCNGGLWIPSWEGSVGLHLLHRFNAYALVAVLAVSAAAGRNEPGLRRFTALALAFGLAEVSVGVANVLLGLPAEVTGLHTGLAAGLVLVLTLGLRDIFTRTAVHP
jgi:heme A synthase